MIISYYYGVADILIIWVTVLPPPSVFRFPEQQRGASVYAPAVETDDTNVGIEVIPYSAWID